MKKIALLWILVFAIFASCLDGKLDRDSASHDFAPPVLRMNQDSEEAGSVVVEKHENELQDAIIVGVWNIFYPSPNLNWGHRFRSGGSYRYVDHTMRAKNERYLLSDGEWRIEGNDIQVRITSYIIADKDPMQDDIGYGFPSDVNYITVEVEEPNWQIIGSLESIQKDIVNNGTEMPPRITLHPIRFDQVLDEEVHYWRDPDES